MGPEFCRHLVRQGQEDEVYAFAFSLRCSFTLAKRGHGSSSDASAAELRHVVSDWECWARIESHQNPRRAQGTYPTRHRLNQCASLKSSHFLRLPASGQKRPLLSLLDSPRDSSHESLGLSFGVRMAPRSQPGPTPCEHPQLLLMMMMMMSTSPPHFLLSHHDPAGSTELFQQAV